MARAKRFEQTRSLVDQWIKCHLNSFQLRNRPTEAKLNFLQINVRIILASA
jgi:hypothetical protein